MITGIQSYFSLEKHCSHKTLCFSRISASTKRYRCFFVFMFENSFDYFLFTDWVRAFPGVNLITFFSGTWMVFRVFGFIAVLAGRSFT